MASIGFVIEQIKQNPARLLRHLPIRQVCLQLGLSYRQRCLDPATTVALFIGQIIDGNSSCAAARHRGDRRFSAQAYCAARQRLPLAVLATRSRRACDLARSQSAAPLFLTQRVFVIDGSSFSMPDTPPLQQEFGQSPNQKPGCGFPVAHLLALFDLDSGMLLHAIPSPMRTHDLSRAAHMHPLLREADLLLGDVAFCSYAHLAQLLQAKLHALMPNQQCRIVDFTPRRPFVRVGEDPYCNGQPRSRCDDVYVVADQVAGAAGSTGGVVQAGPLPAIPQPKGVPCAAGLDRRPRAAPPRLAARAQTPRGADPHYHAAGCAQAPGEEADRAALTPLAGGGEPAAPQDHHGLGGAQV